jgi:uncharacterized protein (DUF2236 family)
VRDDDTVAPQFPKGSTIRRVNLEPAIMFGAGRALMLQIAHPAVAQGVEDHSDFKGNPFTRLIGTLEAVYAVVYGSPELAQGVGRRIRWIHELVVGPGYTANDPANLMWVHATLADTALGCYEQYVGPLTSAEREAYHQEMAEVAVLFGCPRDAQPATYEDFAAYMADQVASIEVTDVGRDLASFILDPTLPLGLHVPLGPVLRLQRRVTLGSLPPAIREQLGQAWTAADDAWFERFQRRARRAVALTPRPLRTAGPRLEGLGFLWLAGRHVRQFDEKMAARAARAARPAGPAGPAPV